MINEGHNPVTYVFFDGDSAASVLNFSNNLAVVSSQPLTEDKKTISLKNLDNLETNTALNENQDNIKSNTENAENLALIIDENKDTAESLPINNENNTASECCVAKDNMCSSNTLGSNLKETINKSGANVINDDGGSSVEKPKLLVTTTANAISQAEKFKPIQKTTEQDLAASVWIRGISNTTKAADLKVFKIKVIILELFFSLRIYFLNMVR